MARLVFSEKEGPSNRYKIKHSKGWRSVNLLLEPSIKNWWEDPDVVVAFNLPRISGCLERLMGTNVVRLTDRNYMKALRDRIDEDHREQLQKRIRGRELKEVERERILIIEGKSDIIPEELSDDPIFMVNKTANIEIQKKRAKLKTNRERNAERLKVQGLKWERERMQHEEEERKRLEMLAQRRREQKELQQRYKTEDAEKGMDLLRIDNEDWRPCEQELKEFLERERAKMKARSEKIPTPFSSDPKDIQNMIRARQKFRETEQRIRAELEEQAKQKKKQRLPVCEKKVNEEDMPPALAGRESSVVTSRRDSIESHYSMALIQEQPLVGQCDESSDLSEDEELAEMGSTISESKRRHAAELEEEMEEDVAKGLLISKEQYEHLRYQEDRIFQLRHARNIRELYELAEEIILGDRFEEESIEEEEEEQPGLEELQEIESGSSDNFS